MLRADLEQFYKNQRKTLKEFVQNIDHIKNQINKHLGDMWKCTTPAPIVQPRPLNRLIPVIYPLEHNPYQHLNPKQLPKPHFKHQSQQIIVRKQKQDTRHNTNQKYL